MPAGEVLKVAEEAGAIPFDIPGAEYGHVGELCSFDAFLRIHRLADPALHALAVIVRGADTGRPDLAPECAGLLAQSLWLSASYADDHEVLRHGMAMCDAYYAWLRHVRGETHPACA